MAVNKMPKLTALTAIGLGGWLLPLACNFAPAIEGFSLALGAISSTLLARETRRETIVSGLTQTEQKLNLERMAYELSLHHEAELNRLRQMYGFGDDLEDDRYQDDRHDRYPDQERLTGATIHQPTIAPGTEPTTGGTLWSLQSLLDSNSSHVLLIGQTGSGKTTLARHLIQQIGGNPIILDADDDGATWKPYPAIGAGDDWVAIEGALLSGLEDFKARQPNDRNLTQAVYILEELPDLISECGTGVEFCSRILRRGRKRKMFVIGLTQDPNTGTIGLSQPVQKCFTRIYLGGMSRYALKNLVPRGQKLELDHLLSGCPRPAIVEFLGEWYAWDVPDLSQNSPAPPPQPTIATTTTDTTEPESTIATLNRIYQADPELMATELHWAIVDLSEQKWISTRDAMRSFSAIKSADNCRKLFSDLVGLELGETKLEGNRTLFRSFA